VLLKAVDGHATSSWIPSLPDNLSNSDPSDGSSALDAPDTTPTGCAGSDSILAESSASESAEFQSKTFESTTSETDTSESTTADGTTPLITSCPHLLSRSDSNIIYDMYLSSTYSVHCQEGWVYRGSRRMMWLPDEFRPASPTSFSAIDDRVVILTKSGERLVFFDFSEFPFLERTESSVIECVSLKGQWSARVFQRLEIHQLVMIKLAFRVIIVHSLMFQFMKYEHYRDTWLGLGGVTIA
jgi:hypothetical protein